jgi:hypothetical protein
MTFVARKFNVRRLLKAAAFLSVTAAGIAGELAINSAPQCAAAPRADLHNGLTDYYNFQRNYLANIYYNSVVEEYGEATTEDQYYEYVNYAYGTADYGLASFSKSLFTNTSALPFAALVTAPVATSVSEVSGLLRQLGTPHFFSSDAKRPNREIDAYYGPFTNSKDGRHPALRGEWETFAFGNLGDADYDNGRNRPVHDSHSWGGLVGAHRWFDDERLIGITASYNFSRSKIHNNGGHIDTDNPRLRLYAALIPESQPWWLAMGASGGLLTTKAKRWQATVPIFLSDPADESTSRAYARSTPEAYEVGAFVALNARLRLFGDTPDERHRLAFTPFVRLDFEHVSVSRFTEHSPDANAMRLHIDGFDAQSVQTRLGGGLEYTLRDENFLLAVGADVAWASELAPKSIRFNASLEDMTGYGYSVTGSQNFGEAFEFTPHVSLTLKNGLTFNANYTVNITLEGQYSQALTIGGSWRF